MEKPKCDHCKSELVARRTKNGREILACPKWKADGSGCQGTIYDPAREQIHKNKYPRVVIRWNVPSRSEPGKLRTVEIYEDGNIRDNCPAGDMMRFCHHQQVVIQESERLLIKIKKENHLPSKEIGDGSIAE